MNRFLSFEVNSEIWLIKQHFLGSISCDTNSEFSLFNLIFLSFEYFIKFWMKFYFTEFDVFSESGESFVELEVMVPVIPNKYFLFFLQMVFSFI